MDQLNQSTLLFTENGNVRIGSAEPEIRIPISKYNKFLNHSEWELIDSYIKNDCQIYQWRNKKDNKAIETLGLNPPCYRLEVQGEAKDLK